MPVLLRGLDSAVVTGITLSSSSVLAGFAPLIAYQFLRNKLGPMGAVGFAYFWVPWLWIYTGVATAIAIVTFLVALRIARNRSIAAVVLTIVAAITVCFTPLWR